MSKEIYVEHPNGYSGRLYGESSMSIYKDGKEVLHTGLRNKQINSQQTLYRQLEDMPMFMKMLSEMSDEDFDDE